MQWAVGNSTREPDSDRSHTRQADPADGFLELGCVGVHLAFGDLAVLELKHLHKLGIDGSSIGFEPAPETSVGNHEVTSAQNLSGAHRKVIPIGGEPSED